MGDEVIGPFDDGDAHLRKSAKKFLAGIVVRCRIALVTGLIIFEVLFICFYCVKPMYSSYYSCC